MTENKAKKNLELLERCYRVSKKGSALYEVLIEFVTLEDLVEAIQALEEVQEYRAIGTVEEIREIFSLCNILSNVVKDYSAIGTIEEFKALKEKNVAKKSLRVPEDDTCLYFENHCPNCDSLLVVRYKHCPNCGQAILRD